MRSAVPKLIVRILGISVLVVVLTSVIIGLFYGEEMKQLAIREINKNLATELKVEKVDFSLLRHFPYASVDLKNVMAKDALPLTANGSPLTPKGEKQSGSDTLLVAKRLSLLFNVIGIFSNHVSIKKIVVDDGSVHVRIDENGKNNYHFWKSSKAMGDSAGSVIDLQKIVLKNVHVTYDNLHDHQRYACIANDGVLTGRFAKDEFELKTDAGLSIEHLYIGGTDYLADKNIKVKCRLLVNNKTEQYRFEETTVRLANLQFDVAGDVTSTDKATAMNLKINSHKADLQELFSVLPASYLNYFSRFKTKGKLAFQSEIKGEAGHGNRPDVKFTFALTDGSLSPKSASVALKELNLNGTLVSSSSHQQELNIRSFNGQLEGRPISGDLKISDFQNPYLSLHAKADVDLASVRPFIDHDTLESLKGNMKLDVAFTGKVKDLKQYVSREDYHSTSSGSIVLNDVAFKLKRNPLEFKNISGQFSLDDNNVDVQSLDGNVSSTDFHLKGVFKKFITFVLIPNQSTTIDVALTSSLIELNELLANKSASAVGDTSYKIKINPRLICALNVSAKKLVFRKFEATNITGMVKVQNQIISSTNLAFNSMDGNVTMSADIATNRSDNVLMGCRARINRINITELFSEMENFGQTTMTDKNVKGVLTADVDFNSTWSKDLVINSSSVVSQADISITNGELNDFKPILPLSKYLKLADLKHIKFATLTNKITIRDRKIFFPSMEINSTALNLTASGTHDFDNMVDYKLKMLLSDVLGRKVKDQQNTEFGVIEDDGLGRSKLFIAMKGPVDNPKFSIDRKAIEEKIKSDLLADKQNVKSILKQEFGLYKKDPSVQLPKKKKEEMQVDWGN